MSESNVQDEIFDPQHHFEKVVRSYDTVDKTQQSITFALQEIDRRISECYNEMLVLYQNLAHCQGLRLRIADALGKWNPFFGHFDASFLGDVAETSMDPSETTPMVRKSLVYKYLQKTPIVDSNETVETSETVTDESSAVLERRRMELDLDLLPPAFRSGNGAVQVKQVYENLTEEAQSIEEIEKRVPTLGKEILLLIISLLARKQLIDETENEDGKKTWSK